MHSGSRAFVALILLVMAVGGALRLQALGSECFWYDEIAQLQYTRRAFVPFMRERWGAVSPPLSELVAWLCNKPLRAAGLTQNELAVRVPAVAFGLATIAVAALAAAQAFGPAAGVLAAALLATNPYHVRYSQEARMYALTVLLMTAAVLFLVRALRSGERRDALRYGLFGAAAVYAHYFALLPFGAASVATFFAWWRARRGPAPAGGEVARLAVLLRGEVIGLALTVPYVVAQSLQARGNPYASRVWLKRLGPPDANTLAQTFKGYATGMLHGVVPALAPGSLDAALTYGAIAALAAMLALGVLGRRDDEPPALRLHLISMVILPFAAVVATSQLRPLYHPRYLMPVFPALLLLLVRARPFALVASLALVPLVVGAVVEPRYHHALLKPDYRGAAAALLRDYRDGDVIDVASVHAQPLRYYGTLAASADAPAIKALAAKAVARDGTPALEVDAILPSPTTPTATLRDRLAPPAQLQSGKTLLFADGPIPYLRLWRSQDGAAR